MSLENEKTKPDVADYQAYEGSVEELLPHRDPFLFVDRVLHVDKTFTIGEKTFGEDMWFFKGHFPH